MGLEMRAPSEDPQLEAAHVPEETAPVADVPAKRKREGDDDDDDKVVRKAKRKAAKAAKRAAVRASAQADEENIDDTLQINRAIGNMNSALLSDHTSRQFQRFQYKLSHAELEAKRVPQAAFLDTSSWEKPRVLDGMADFIDRFAGQSREALATAPATNGAPHTIVVCGAAIRAADATRALRCYQKKDAAVGKLFAKHIKLKDAISSASKTRMSVAVGTPQRILDLVEAGALSLSHLRRIVIDGSWSGAMKRTLFETSDAMVPTTRLLALEQIKERYGRGAEEGVTVLVY